MRVVALPGVYRPKSDTQMLMRALFEAAQPLASRSVLELCAGSGALAVAAARAGADVLAVDVSRRAVLNARLNARINGVRIRAVDGDLWEPVRRRRFDVIIANPPYLPTPNTDPPAGMARGVDGGRDGRSLIDPICSEAAGHLHPGGKILLVHSCLADPDATEEALARTGLETRVLARQEGELGPIAAGREGWLRKHGRLRPDGRETLVVIEGRVPERSGRTAEGRLTGDPSSIRAA